MWYPNSRNSVTVLREILLGETIMIQRIRRIVAIIEVNLLVQLSDIQENAHIAQKAECIQYRLRV